MVNVLVFDYFNSSLWFQIIIGYIAAEVLLEEFHKYVSVEYVKSLYDFGVLQHVIETASGNTVVDGCNRISLIKVEGLIFIGLLVEHFDVEYRMVRDASREAETGHLRERAVFNGQERAVLAKQLLNGRSIGFHYP